MNILHNVARFYFAHFPIEKGKWRLWDLFSHRYETPLLTEEGYSLKYGFKIRLDTRDRIDRFIYYWKCWEPNESWAIKKVLRPGDTFVDIGANIGYFALLASKIVGTTGKVIAFEPVPTTFERLRHNVELNGMANITIKECALSDKEGIVRIYQVSDPTSGMNSMRKNIKGTGVYWDVQTKPFDKVLPLQEAVKMVKIDVEGAELLVLKGLKERLSSKNPPFVLCEVTDGYMRSLGETAAELLQFMDDLGYKGYLIDGCQFSRKNLNELITLCSKAAPNILFVKGDLNL